MPMLTQKLLLGLRSIRSIGHTRRCSRRPLSVDGILQRDFRLPDRVLLTVYTVGVNRDGGQSNSLRVEVEEAHAGDTINVESGLGGIVLQKVPPILITQPGLTINFNGDSLANGHGTPSLEVASGATLALNGATIENGMILDGGSNATVNGGTITSANVGIAVGAGANLTAVNELFTGISVGIQNTNGNVNVQNSTLANLGSAVSDNQTAGGGLNISSTTIRNTTSTAVTAAAAGGTKVTMTGDVLSYNSDGVVNFTGDATSQFNLVYSTDDNNTSTVPSVSNITLNGGTDTFNGVYLAYNHQLGSVVIATNTNTQSYNSAYSNNVSGSTSAGVGGALVFAGGTFGQHGDTVTYNHTFGMQAGLLTSARAQINSSTYFGNAGGDGTGGVGVETVSGGTVNLDSDILYGNTVDVAGANVTGEYCDVGLAAGSFSNTLYGDPGLNTTANSVHQLVPLTTSQVRHHGDPQFGYNSAGMVNNIGPV